MNLTDALNDAARTATADRTDLPAGPVLHRIRRRRVARTATQGTLGVAAVGLLALGGSRLPLWDQPAATGPAGPTPTTSGPAPVTPVPGIVCGQSFDDVLAAAEPGVTLEFTPDEAGPPPDATSDQEITGRLTMASTDPDGPQVMPEVLEGVGLVVVEGDTVIGFGDVTIEPDGAAADTEGGAAADVRVALAACSATGEVDGPLAAGSYLTYAVLPVGVVDGSDDRREGTVVSTMEEVLVTVVAETDDDPAAAYLWLPKCGESTTGLVATAGPLTGSSEIAVGEGDPQTGEFRETGSGPVVLVRTAVTNGGPDLADAHSLVTEGVVAREGTVVATWFDVGGDLPPVDWPAGTTREGTDGVFALERCDDGSPLEAGTYTMWAMSIAGGLDSWGDPPLRVVHQPVELRIGD